MNDIYSTPEAELSTLQANDEYGSLDRAVIGEYQLTIGDVIKEAWQKTKGAKWRIHLAFGLYLIVFMLLAIALFFIEQALGLSPDTSAESTPENSAVMLVWQIVFNLVSMPMIMGIFMLGLKRAVDAPLSATSIFHYFNRMFALFFTTVLMYIMIIIGFLLFIIPGIYLSIAYYMAMPLVVEKELSPWQALETSRKAVGKRWFSFLGFGIVIFLINLGGLLSLGLGLIWTIPFSIIAFGIVYRNMFGCESATINH